MALLEVKELRKVYGDLEAVGGISFDVDEGEFTTLVGPSGCGKTTTLKTIAGLLEPTSGAIRIQGEEVTYTPSRKRPCSLVFQSLALFPHMTIRENLSYPLEARGGREGDRTDRIERMMDLVELPLGYLEDYPRQLSGGEQQRVALARSLIYDPSILLLDEPLSSLDFQLRKQLRKTLSDLHKKSGKTFLYVTHSLEEALSLSDSIMVMKDGQVLQRGTPDEIFNRPASRFVAEFLGDTNTFDVEVAKSQPDDEAPRRYRVPELDTEFTVQRHSNLERGHLIVRAHEVQLRPNPDLENCLEVEIFNRYDLGGTVEYALRVVGAETRLTCLRPKSEAVRTNGTETLFAQWDSENGVLLER